MEVRDFANGWQCFASTEGATSDRDSGCCQFALQLPGIQVRLTNDVPKKSSKRTKKNKNMLEIYRGRSISQSSRIVHSSHDFLVKS